MQTDIEGKRDFTQRDSPNIAAFIFSIHVSRLPELDSRELVSLPVFVHSLHTAASNRHRHGVKLTAIPRPRRLSSTISFTPESWTNS